ncbi:MAG: VCBS repeat-containing protein [Proteobacteria bacterium]|nr:VCBS repeat-containing protein [Pseudomonadota bacterium]
MRAPRALALAASLAICAAAGISVAGDKRAPRTNYYGSSLLAWVDAVAAAVEDRAHEGGVTLVSVEVQGGRGVEDRKADRVFGPRLSRQLQSRGELSVVQPGTRGSLQIRIELSLEGSRLWAVGLAEGGKLDGPAALAVSWTVDRELETVLLSGGARAGQARWSMQRLGTAPAGVLDAALVDLDGDGGDEIILLGTDGVRALRYRGADARPEAVGGPWALPGGGEWPRVIAGWIAPDGGSGVRIGTTAGHAATLNAASGRWSAVGTPAAIPLRQPRDASRTAWRGGDLVGAGADLDGQSLGDGLPERVRDAVLLPNGTWIWLDGNGRLGARYTPSVSLPAGRFGDRFVLADLDGDGTHDLVTTSASPPGEPDSVTIHRLDAALEGHSVLFSSSLDGSVVAVCAGDLDFDGETDLLLVEEGRDADAVLWRVERSR